MKRESRTDRKSGQPHSERACEAVFDSGAQATLYRALRDLTCSRCAGTIREGELFSRELDRAGLMPLVRRCRTCVPFSVAGGLLEALLTPEASGGAAPASPMAEAKEKMLSRLGPVLAACRKERDTDR